MSVIMSKKWCFLLYVLLLPGCISCYDSGEDWMKELENSSENSENGLENNFKEDSNNEFASDSEKDLKGVSKNSDEDWMNELEDSSENSENGLGTNFREDSNTEFATNSEKDLKEVSKNDFVTESGNDLKETTVSSFGDVLDNSLEIDCNDPFRDMIDNGNKKCDPITEDPPEDKNKCNLELIRDVEKILIETYLDARSREPMDLDSDLQITFFMKIHDGKLTGLSTLINTTETKTTCNENSNIVKFNTTLRMTNARIDYNWTRRGPFGFTQRGTFWMQADVLDFYLEVLLDMTDANKVTYSVTYTLFAKPEDVTMEFKGLGILDYGINFGLRTMYKFFKEKLDKAIELAVAFILEQKIGIVVEIHNSRIFK